MKISSSKKIGKNVSRLLLSFGLVLLAGANALPAPADSNLAAAQLKPEVLYIDLANPATARGIALENSNEVANLVTKEVGGMPAAEPKNGAVVLTLNPALVKAKVPLLVAFSFYDSDPAGWEEPMIQGFLRRPEAQGYSVVRPRAGSRADAWRWWTTFTYANYKAYAKEKDRASFRLTVKYPRWILVLPMSEATTRQMNGIRDKALAMMTDYNRCITAAARLEESRERLGQAAAYLRSGGEVPRTVAEALAAVNRSGEQSRADMEVVCRELLSVWDPIYLDMFDAKAKECPSTPENFSARILSAVGLSGGETTERLATLEAFRRKMSNLARIYNASADRAEGVIAEQAAAQRAARGLGAIVLKSPEKIALDTIIRPDDIKSRFFLGLTASTYLRCLPQKSVDSLIGDLGQDFVADYSLSSVIEPREDGSYDFSLLDNQLLGKTKGLRVELGLHNIPLLPGRAEKKYFGEQPEKSPSPSRGYDHYRVKAADGRWDGFCLWDPNPPRSFTPAAYIWSETLFNYACDLYRTMARHYRDNPAIVRYMINTEGGAGGAMRLGYVWDSALPYYREYLKKRFDDIQQLNKAFGTAYKGFDEIPLPKPAEGEKMVRLTPAYYEYAQCCIDRVKLVRESFARVIRREDPDHPIGECASTRSMYSIDQYKQVTGTPYDTFCAGCSDVSSIDIINCYNRYHPRPVWTYEPYTWGWDFKDKRGYAEEELTRRWLSDHLWQWFVFGNQRALPLFNSKQGNKEGEDKTSGYITEHRISDVMLQETPCPWQPKSAWLTYRLGAGSLALIHERFNRLGSLLWSTAIVPAKVGLFESATSAAVPYPPRMVDGDLDSTIVCLNETSRKILCSYIPETAVVEDVEDLAPYRVIIAAYATHLRPEARERLLAWVENGGSLIASGPVGLFDHYGRTDGNLPERIFGMKGIEYGKGLTEDSKLANCGGGMAGCDGVPLWQTRNSFWKFPAAGLLPGTKVSATLADGTPVVVERAYGKGKVTMTANSLREMLVSGVKNVYPYIYQQILLQEIARAMPKAEVQISGYHSATHVQLRQDSEGSYYLGIICADWSFVADSSEATITVAGEFAAPMDLTFGDGFPIAAQIANGETKFKVWMKPGTGNFIRLGKPNKPLAETTAVTDSLRLQIRFMESLFRQAEALGIGAQDYRQALGRVRQAEGQGKWRAAQEGLDGLYTEIVVRMLDARMKQDAGAAQARRALGVTPAAKTDAVVKAEGGVGVADDCRKVARWSAYGGSGSSAAGNLEARFDDAEKLPAGKQGAIVLSRPAKSAKARLMIVFNDRIGKRRGLAVWIKGSGSGGGIEFRVSGSEQYDWVKLLKDDSKEWRRVEIDLAQCEKTTESGFYETGAHGLTRSNLDRLIVQLSAPATTVKIGLIEYLPE